MTTTARTWRLDLPYRRPPLNLNQRMHWAKRHRITQQIVNDVTTLARAAKLPRGLDRVVVTLHWQASQRRRRDLDNVYPTLKAVIDGLRLYGLVPDDDAAHVKPEASIEPTGPDAVWVTIRETSDEESNHE